MNAQQIATKINARIAKRDELGKAEYREGLVAVAEFFVTHAVEIETQPWDDRITDRELHETVIAAHRAGTITDDERNLMTGAISATRLSIAIA